MFGWGNRKSAAQIFDEIPADLSGKVCIITGGTAGLGLASAQVLYERGAHVIFTARNETRGKEAFERIMSQAKSGSKGKLEYGIMDQKSLLSVKAFAESFLQKKLPLHVLMLNAGIAVVPFELVDDTVESHFFVNHLSHYYLTRLLLDKVKASAPSRIVVLSSDAHKFVRQGEIDWNTVHNQKYDGLQASFAQYGASKLANIAFTKQLAKELENTKVWVNAVHPGKIIFFTISYEGIDVVRIGAVDTNLPSKVRLYDTWFGKALVGLIRVFMYAPEDAAVTQLYLAVHPEVEVKDYRGQYFSPLASLTDPTDLAKDSKSMESLELLSQKLVKEILSIEERSSVSK